MLYITVIKIKGKISVPIRPGALEGVLTGCSPPTPPTEPPPAPPGTSRYSGTPAAGDPQPAAGPSRSPGWACAPRSHRPAGIRPSRRPRRGRWRTRDTHDHPPARRQSRRCACFPARGLEPRRRGRSGCRWQWSWADPPHAVDLAKGLGRGTLRNGDQGVLLMGDNKASRPKHR